jgi:hypothetical protein
MTSPPNLFAPHAPRCRARCKRTGAPCRCPAVRDRGVCRAHGGAGRRVKGEEHGRYKHGGRSLEAREALRQQRAALREARALLKELEGKI